MPEPEAKGAVGLRRLLVERRQTRQALWLLTLVLLAGGLALALEGVWAGAVPVLVLGGALAWLVGAWVAPRGGDAYVLVSDGPGGLGRQTRKLAYEQFAVRQADFAQR